MSHYAQPKQILKKDISSKEFSLLEEWAPQTLHGYHYPQSSSPTASFQPETMPNTVHDPIHRRNKNRSSSLYEEWKAQAARNETANEVTTPAIKENEDRQVADNVTPALDGAAGAVGSNVRGGTGSTQDKVAAPVQLSGNRHTHVQNTLNHATISRNSTRIPDSRPVIVSNNRRAPKPSTEAKKTVVTQTTPRSEVKPSCQPCNNVEPTKSNPSVTPSTKTISKGVSESKKSIGSQPVSRPEVGGYTAPNGTHLRANELQKLSSGVKVPNKDTAYFFPSFVEDPWKNVKPILTECSARW